MIGPDEQQLNDQNKTFRCDKCDFTFDSKPDLEHHPQGIQHNIATREKSEIDDSDEEDDDDNFREKCYLCQKIFTDFDNLDDHQSNYIRCEKCAVCYHNEFEYKKHENCED